MAPLVVALVHKAAIHAMFDHTCGQQRRELDTLPGARRGHVPPAAPSSDELLAKCPSSRVVLSMCATPRASTTSAARKKSKLAKHSYTAPTARPVSHFDSRLSGGSARGLSPASA